MKNLSETVFHLSGKHHFFHCHADCHESFFLWIIEGIYLNNPPNYWLMLTSLLTASNKNKARTFLFLAMCVRYGQGERLKIVSDVESKSSMELLWYEILSKNNFLRMFDATLIKNITRILKTSDSIYQRVIHICHFLSLLVSVLLLLPWRFNKLSRLGAQSIFRICMEPLTLASLETQQHTKFFPWAGKL